MKVSKILDDVTKENIFKYVTPIQIFENYMDHPIFDKAFSSPFRKDNNPSFIVRKSKAYFKDYATGEYGDCFNFVKKLYKLNYNDTLIQIIMDMGLKEHFNLPDYKYKLRRKAEISNIIKGKSYKGDFNLNIKKRDWTNADLEYWDSYGVKSKAALEWANIFPISHYFINNIPYKAEIYAYVYVENKDNKPTYKVYQPFSKYKKWINANDYSVWELWSVINSSQFHPWLIITSSRKDSLSIMSNIRFKDQTTKQIKSIKSTAFQAETIMPKEHVMKILMRTGPIFLLYDNDFDSERNWGQIAANRLIEKYPALINLKIPTEYKSKDFSDLYFNHGEETAVKVLKNEIQSRIPF